MTATLTINKKEIDTSVVVFNNLTVNYDGTVKSITATNLPTGITVNYTNNNQTNAGTYTVTATFVYDNDNCTVTVASKTATLTINKINPTYTVPTNLKAFVGQTLNDVTLPARFTWNDPVTTSVGSEGNNTFLVTYTPADTTNYNTINNIEVTITVTEASIYAIICANNQSTTYNALEQGPTVTVKLNDEVVTNNYTLSYAYKLTSSSAYTDGLPTNAGTYNIKITCSGSEGSNAEEVIVTFTINKAKLTVATTSVTLDYSSEVRTWAQVQQAIPTINVSGLIGTDTTTVSVIGMHNGNYKYGTVSGDYTAPTADPIFGSSYNNVIGSTYLLFISQNNTNYELNDYQIVFKYKTAKISSTFYTIEDALGATGTITFVGDSTGAQTYVATVFSSLPTSITGYSTSYTISSRTIVVPYESGSTTDKAEGVSETSGNVCSCLIVPEGITLIATGSTEIYAAAKFNSAQPHLTRTTTRGVIVNNGIIEMRTGTKLYAYGYIKGTGTIYMKSGSNLRECIRVYDFTGGTAASAIYGDVFIINSYSIHNDSCETYIYGGATMDVYLYHYVGGGGNTTAYLIGKNSTNNCLFAPSSDTESNYIVKGATSTTSLIPITSVNQGVTQKDKMDIHGSYIDKQLKVTVYVSLQTTTTKPCPIGLMDITLKSNSTLELSKNSYLFLPGSSLTIEENSTLKVTNSAVNLTFASYNDIHSQGGNQEFTTSNFSNALSSSFDSYLLCNGTLTSSGKIGGYIKTTSEHATLNINGSTTSSYICKKSTDNPRYFETSKNTSFGLLANGSINDTLITAGGTYYSILHNGKYGFYANTAKISYNTNGGSGSYSPKSITLGSSGYTISASDLPSTNPTKQYYTFSGWYADSDCTILANGYVIYSGIELYAKWTPTSYNIVYEDKYDGDFSSGNTSTSTNPTTFTYETNVPLVDPINGDYTFGGWYINSSCTNRINSITGSSLVSYLSSNSITIYALWYNAGTDRYVITFNNSNEYVTCAETDSIVDLSGYNLPDMTTKDNDYTVPLYFGGWYKGETLVASIDSTLFTYNATTGIYELELTAQWLDKNTLDVNVGTFGTIMTVYYVSGFSFTVPSLESKGIKLGSSGLVLLNWQLDDGNTYVSGDVIALTNQTQLIANIVSFVSVSIKTSDYTTVTVTLTSNTGYLVTYNAETGISSATPFNGSTKTNGSDFYITSGSKFNAKYAAKSGTGNGGTITGTTPTTALSTTDQQYTAGTSSIEITPTGSEASSCVVEGTLITMADGTKKAVEDIVAGDLLLVFNHETGEYDVSIVLFNDSEELNYYKVINLEFSNGSIVKVVSEHGFFDLDLMKYVYITEENYTLFVNHRFYAYGGEIVTLDNAYITIEETRVYSPVTAFHLNYFTEDLLSMPGGIKGLFNIFEYDQ